METGDRLRPGERIERIYQNISTTPKYHPSPSPKKTPAAATTITSLLVDDLENGGTGMNTKRRRRLRSVLNSMDLTLRKDEEEEEEEEREREKATVAGDTSQGEWGTDDFDTEASAASGSASEVEDQVRDNMEEAKEMDGDTEQRGREKM